MAFIKQASLKLYNMVRAQLQREFVRFCLVGGIGFIVNLSALVLVRDIWHAPVVLAVLVGGETSLISNFLFHNFWTYKEAHPNKKIATLFFQFHLTFWVGNGINALLTLGMIALGWHEALALAIASIIVLFWNFAWTRYYIWRAKDVTSA